MPKNQEWFEMGAYRKRRLNEAVWIPLRAAETKETGEFGHLGHLKEYFGAGSVAVPLIARNKGEGWSWEHLSLMHDHRGFVGDGLYRPADSYDTGQDGANAVRLAIAQRGNSEEPPEWHLHQDLVVTLDLKREKDVWVAINEDYREVARLKRQDGRPVLLEVKAEFLKDYLCARGMALRVSSYRNHEELVADAGHINWPTDLVKTISGENRWEGRKTDIHVGGDMFGSRAAVLHIAMTDVDYDLDVPHIDESEQTSQYWETESTGDKLIRIEGELWRDEWVEPAERSTRIRDDEPATSISFLVNAAGSRVASTELATTNGWLWFKPELMTTLADRRGGRIIWYTRDTGGVRASPVTTYKHFGVNELGLVNFFAEDIVRLPLWIQQICSGFNITPEGGVSKELLMAQMEGRPAGTRAPEAILPKSIERLNAACQTKFGFELFRGHDQGGDMLSRVTRFKSLDQSGLFGLAKDITRITADSINVSELKKVLKPPKDENARSLKLLERLLAKYANPSMAHEIVGPLFGIYDLRLADAHPPGSNLDDALALANIYSSQPFVTQGLQLIDSCVKALFAILAIIEGLPGSASMR